MQNSKVYKNEKFQEFLESDTHKIKMLCTLLSLFKISHFIMSKFIFGKQQYGNNVDVSHIYFLQRIYNQITKC